MTTFYATTLRRWLPGLALALAMLFGCDDDAGIDHATDTSHEYDDTSPGIADTGEAPGPDTDSDVPNDTGPIASDPGDTQTTQTDDSDHSDTEDTQPVLEFSFGKPHLKITAQKESNWSMQIAADSLSRRILGLRWTVKPKDLFWSEEFEIWPEADNDVSDARLYRLAQMFTHDPWVISVEPVLAGPDFQVPTGKEALLPIDDPVWYLGPEGINAYEAWAMFAKIGKKPGQGILIGLPDTGYLEHPELFHNDGTTQLRLDLQRNFSETSKEKDARDYCDTLCGLTVNKTVKLAYVGHGTTTASLIISPPGKQPGTIGHLHTEGAAQHAQVIPIRVSPSVLMTPTAMTKLARGIEYATEQGAKVISISMGGVTFSDHELLEAIRRAISQGAIVVAAAGNTPYNNPTPWMNDVSKPAAYEETIAVGGSNAYQAPWRDTSRGPEVDICAPAEDIRRARAGWVNMTEHVNDTDRGEGTSMSTALSASVAALWLSYHGHENLVAHYDDDPSKLQEAFRKIITTTGNRRPPGWDTTRYGAGILDAAKVLAAPLPDLE